MDKLPQHNIANFVKNLSKEHNVQYRNNSADLFGEKIIELDNHDFEFDETKALLLSLTRENIITRKEMLYLLLKYIDELKNVT